LAVWLFFCLSVSLFFFFSVSMLVCLFVCLFWNTIYFSDKNKFLIVFINNSIQLVSYWFYAIWFGFKCIIKDFSFHFQMNWRYIIWWFKLILLRNILLISNFILKSPHFHL
jgi:hypothetical protein